MAMAMVGDFLESEADPEGVELPAPIVGDAVEDAGIFVLSLPEGFAVGEATGMEEPRLVKATASKVPAVKIKESLEQQEVFAPEY